MSRVLLLAALPTLLFAQTTQASPDQEIRKLLEEDQAARQGVLPPTLAQDDAARLARARSLVYADGFQDAHSYDAAATLFQHGAELHDHLIARELALWACFKRATYTGMPALAEDRFLVKLGRLQRFGAYFPGGSPDATPAPIQEAGANAVTDALRLDFLQPTLDQAKTKGLMFIQSGQSFAQALPRIQARMASPTQGPVWLTGEDLSRCTQELSRLETLPPKEGTARREGVLALYRKDLLFVPSDYHRASVLLLGCFQSAEDLLLANEWAALAIMRWYEPAWRPFSESWDRFAEAIGQPARYGTRPGLAIQPSVVPPLRKLLERLGRP